MDAFLGADSSSSYSSQLSRSQDGYNAENLRCSVTAVCLLSTKSFACMWFLPCIAIMPDFW